METMVFKEGKLFLLDQSILPNEIVYHEYSYFTDIAEAIKTMKVRGAPAIGVAAAYGYVLAAYQYRDLEKDFFFEKMQEAARILSETRPTAVNLFWALERMKKLMNIKTEDINDILSVLEKEADAIKKEDFFMNQSIGDFGAELIKKDATILTHCNAGALATAGYGTALGVIRSVHKKNKLKMVYADETRPLLQGARLTVFELMEDNIPVTLITDNMAGYLMKKRMVDYVIVGADRIAANGDVANKIGTYSVAVLAKHHGIPFFVAAPYSTLDLSLKSGEDIPIEEREADEIRKIKNYWVAPKEAKVFNPAFDITPSDLITAIITDKGVIYPDYRENLPRVLVQNNE